ncbi:MAG: chemotaxis response regulator protein-glutamate methylesterase [Nitrospirae bacterium]|nr:chemotaxis response regulator protein-glutamate methylesterase [Nitrospirota bacterium]
MPEPIRVLIVDDSSIVRRAVSDALANAPEITVVGTAPNGKIALDRIRQLNPEVVILDIEMPEADGFEVLRVLRVAHPKVRTIMFSTLTQRGASQTIQALSLGAHDYVTKPSSIGQGYGEVLKRVAADLVPKIKQFRPELCESAPVGANRPAALPRNGAGVRAAPKIVAIGVSTGGPEALAKVLPRLPKGFPVPVLIVQHMPPVFTKLLAERLDAGSDIKVTEGIDGVSPEAGVAYVAPGDHHMVVARKNGRIVLSLNQAVPENSCRPAADPLFRSVAEVYGPQALGVIMTGMGQDGLIGLRAMKARGATVFAQDKETSVVWCMPSFVVHEGLADRVIPLGEIAAAVEAAVSHDVVGLHR